MSPRVLIYGDLLRITDVDDTFTTIPVWIFLPIYDDNRNSNGTSVNGRVQWMNLVMIEPCRGVINFVGAEKYSALERRWFACQRRTDNVHGGEPCAL